MAEDDGRDAPRAKRQTLVETVTDEIAELILAGEFRPGDKLNEVELAERLGVSRGPVREASRHLQEMGLLVGHPFRGSFVRKLTQREVADIYKLRVVLECTAAEEAVRLVEPADLAAIEAAWRDTELAALSNAAGRMIEADVAFHTALCRAGHNRRIADNFARLVAELRLVHLMMEPEPGRLRAAAREHAAILDALRQRRSERLLAALRAHISDERDTVLQYLGPHGDTPLRSSGPDPAENTGPTHAGRIDLRPHRRDDFPLLARMNRQLVDDEGHPNAMDVAQMEERFARFVDREGYSIDLFTLDAETVGYAAHRREPDPSRPGTDRVFLRQFFIVQPYRREGLGQAAFEALNAERFRVGDRLALEVIENNPGGRVFWMRLGFTPYSTILENIVTHNITDASKKSG